MSFIVHNDMLCPVCNASSLTDNGSCQVCGASLDQDTSAAFAHALPSGTLLHGGAYSVDKMLGQGGFGITYLGSDVLLQRKVAIKEFFPAGCARQTCTVVPAGGWTLGTYTETKGRFLQEGRVLARFNHPGVVHVFAVFEENNTAYMVMEYLCGKSLATVLQERGRATSGIPHVIGQGLSEEEAVGYIDQIGVALEVLHGSGILHRDIKPENIMIRDDGRAVLVDFGTAKDFTTHKTQSYSIVVTPGYAPLEQYAQRAQRGPYTDVYALAATLYYLLTGEPPAPATDRAAGVELVDLRRLNAGISEVVAAAVMEAMAMEVAQRPQSVRDFLDRLKGKNQVALSHSSERIASSSTAPIASRQHSPDYMFTIEGSYGLAAGLAFSPEGSMLAVGGLEETITLWNIPTAQLIRTLQTRHETGAVAFSPDGKMLASGTWAGVDLWDLHTGILLQTLEVHQGWIHSVAFSPGPVHEVGQVSVNAGEEATAFSSDGEMMGSGSDDKSVRVWDARTGTLLQMMQGHSDKVTSLAFHPDGKLLASASCDKTVRLWDVRTGRLLRTLGDHSKEVSSVAFSPDGQLLATGSHDKTVRLWGAHTGDSLYTLQGHKNKVTTVAFSPDGKLLASGSLDKTVRLWRIG